MNITSVYTTATLAALKTSNDDYIANKYMYRELNTIRLKVLGENNLGSSGTYVAHNYTYTYDASKADYFGTLLQKLSEMFPDMFIYYTLNSVSSILTETSVLLTKPFNSNAYSASIVSVTNTIFISQSTLIIPINAFTVATIGTPINATYAPINNRKCWEIIGNTTITFDQYSGSINFVVVGGGQNSNSIGYSGGNGGGVVYGSFNITQNYTQTVTIGSSDMPTTIIGIDINIIANGGTVNGGSATGSKIVSSTGQNGGLGGVGYKNLGGDGNFISDLGIYVAGGGSSNAYYTPSGQFSYLIFNVGGAGGGGGFDDYSNINIPNGVPNTGGGAEGGTTNNIVNFGGSGVVYLYI